MKKVTFISDTHCKHNRIELPEGDILIYAGDFMSSGYSQMEFNSFINWLSEQPYKYKICIAGNHDRYCEAFPQYVIKDLFEEYYDHGVRYLCDECIEIEGLKIYGTPYQPYFCDWAFNVANEDELYSIYKKIPEDLDILITHCPPYDILDKSHRVFLNNDGNNPLGSGALKRALDELGDHAPKYHVFGHIHGDGGKTEKIGNTTYINAAVCDEQYVPKNKIVQLLFS